MTTRPFFKSVLIALTAILSLSGLPAKALETVNVSLFSWPGYGFWFIAKEKGLAEGIDLDIKIIEDPYESFAAMAAGQLDITSSTVEYGPIAAEEGVPVKLVAYTNPSIGTDKIILGPDIESPAELKGKKVAVMEGGLTQIYMGIWLEENGLKFDDVTYVNVIMDDAVGAMVSGEVSAGEFWEPFGTNVLKNLEGTQVMATSAEPYWRETALLADGMYMSDGFIKEKPAAAAAAMDAYFKAVAWWKENPEEGNEIIAKALQFPVSDVELVISADGNGEANTGGIWPFTLDESARFMKLKEGPVPIGSEDGINAHWALTNEWWVKFGVMTKTLPPSSGIDLTPMKAVLE